MKTLVERLTTDRPELIVLEATGGYELPVVAALASDERLASCHAP